MKTGTKKNKVNNSAVKVVAVACLLFVLFRLGQFVTAHIPPYKAGTCLAMPLNPFVQVKILENHILGGYSDAEVVLLIISQTGPMSFEEQRSPEFAKVECADEK